MMKKCLIPVLAILLCWVCCFTVHAAPPRLVDDAGLLEEYEALDIAARLDTVSEGWQFDLVIVTRYGLDGQSAMSYADDYYDENGYGFGSDYDGALLLVDMEGREWWISTCGYGIYALDSYTIDDIGDAMQYDLANGFYADAFETFIAECDRALAAAADGEDVYGDDYDYDYDYDSGESESLPWIAVIFVPLIGGFIVALIVVSSMKRKLTSVRPQPAAGNYIRAGSFVVTDRRDLFLYSTINRRKRPQNNSSSGGGSHRSSSGRSHGGGGGRF